MIYLYAIAGQFDSPLDPPPGIENQAVYKINCGSFTPVVSTLLTGEVNLSKEAIYRHENVVEFFMKHTSILPVQFNTLFDTTETLTGTLKRYNLEIETNLLKVANCVEMGVKILAKELRTQDVIASDPHASLGAGSAIPIEKRTTIGTASALPRSKAKKYILDKFSSHKEAFYLQEKYKAQGKVIYSLLKEFAKQGTVFPIAANSYMILNSAFLVPRASVANFKERFHSIKKDHKELAFLLSGPWPPYSFVDFQIEKAQTKEENKDELCLS